MSTITKTVKLDDQLIEALEDFQASEDLGYSKRYTHRRKTTFENIENILKQDSIEFKTIHDKRNKLNDYILSYLGEIVRIDTVKASFVETAYLDLELKAIRTFNHCVRYNV